MLTTISTKGMSREVWLEHRRKAIGGSDAAAIIGLNDFASPFTVWMDKLGKTPPAEESEAMRLGRDLEEYVARRFCEATGKRVRRKNAIIYNDQYPFAHANIDREIVGENAILECKTTSRMNMRRFKAGDYPPSYYAQVMHYMAVTGAEKAYIAVLALQEGFHCFEVARDEQEIEALMNAERSFWQYVTAREEPPAISADGDALFQEHPVSDGTSIDLFGRASQMARYLQIKGQIKVLENEAAAISATIKQDLGDHESGSDGAYTATWKSQERSIFDKAAFIAANPEIDLRPYMKPSPSRVFTVKQYEGGTTP